MLPEILGHLMELMVDPFGNYLIQKLLDRCDEAQRLQVCWADGRMSGSALVRLLGCLRVHLLSVHTQAAFHLALSLLMRCQS